MSQAASYSLGDTLWAINDTMFALVTPIPLLAIGLLLIWFSARHLATGAWLLVATIVLENAFITPPQWSWLINVSSTDISTVALLIAGTLRFCCWPHDTNPDRRLLLAWLAFGGIIALTLGRGLLQFGTSAGVEGRELFYCWAVGSYLLSFSPSANRLNELKAPANTLIWLLVAVAVIRWIGYAEGWLDLDTIEEIGAKGEFRVLNAQATFLIAAASLAWLVVWLDTGRSSASIPFLLLASVNALLFHRSVWVAQLLGMLTLAVLTQRTQLRRLFDWRIGLILSVTILGWYLYYHSTNSLAEAFEKSIATAIANENTTFIDRFLGWAELLNQWSNFSLFDKSLGQPFGHGFDRVVLGRLVEYSPHSQYVFMLLRGGVIGLIIYAGLFVYIAIEFMRAIRQSSSTAMFGLTMLISISAFVAVYQLSYSILAILLVSKIVADQRKQPA